jgi:hypothetical protein
VFTHDPFTPALTAAHAARAALWRSYVHHYGSDFMESLSHPAATSLAPPARSWGDIVAEQASGLRSRAADAAGKAAASAAAADEVAGAATSMAAAVDAAAASKAATGASTAWRDDDCAAWAARAQSAVVWLQRSEPVPVFVQAAAALADWSAALGNGTGAAAASAAAAAAEAQADAPVVIHVYASIPVPRPSCSSDAKRSANTTDGGRDVSRGVQMQRCAAAVRAASVELTIPFEKQLLPLDRYPPDVSRGFELPPVAVAVIGVLRAKPRAEQTREQHEAAHLPRYSPQVVSRAGTRRGEDLAFAAFVGPVAEVHLTGLIMQVPFPDASMPFNVIAVVCTAIAFFFGSMFNLLYNSDDDFVLLQKSNKIVRKCTAKRAGQAVGSAAVCPPLDDPEE